MNDQVKNTWRRGVTAAVLTPAAVLGIASCSNSPPSDTPVITHSTQLTDANVPFSSIRNDMKSAFQRCEALPEAKLVVLLPDTTVTFENRTVAPDVASQIVEAHNREVTNTRDAQGAECVAEAMTALEKKYEATEGNGDEEEHHVELSKYVVTVAKTTAQRTATQEKADAAEAKTAQVAIARGDLTRNDAGVRESLADARAQTRIAKEASQLERDALLTAGALKTARCDYDRATDFPSYNFGCSYVSYGGDSVSQNEAEWIAFDRSAGAALGKAEALASGVRDANELFRDEGALITLSPSVEKVATSYRWVDFWASLSGDQEYRDLMTGDQITAMSVAVDTTKTEAANIARTYEGKAQSANQQVDAKAQQEIIQILSKTS